MQPLCERENMFVKLTHFETGNPLMVNMIHVCFIDSLSNGTTRLVINQDLAYLVKESFDEVSQLAVLSNGT
jgi:hypothetical protein